jgi:hypothetical protein
VSVFKIRYEDPQTRERKWVIAAFDDAGSIAAADWAKDYAYTLADKGWHEVENIDPEVRRMLADGWTVSQVAQKLKVGRDAIRRITK